MLLSEVKLHPSMKALPPPQDSAAGNVGVQEISLDNLDSSMKAPNARGAAGRSQLRPYAWEKKGRKHALKCSRIPLNESPAPPACSAQPQSGEVGE